MGQEPSKPKPGTQLQVIGAGLPRTGTSSFSLALSILLDGPAYHGGTQATLGPPQEMRSWITLLQHWPAKTTSDAAIVNKILKERLDGYVGVTDCPCNGLVPELLELYPDAIVIATVRDPQAWINSMQTVSHAAKLWFLYIVLLPLPTMRHFTAYIEAMGKQWEELYGPQHIDIQHWHTHVAYLERVVPKEKLFWFDVRDGWGPLCEMLGKEVPDVPFPRVNDGKAIEELVRTMVVSGLTRWAGILGTVGAVGVGIWWARAGW
ncbi:putative NAD dependent epimerase/dehydratase [Decorospora gaudefroyi]|uniref:Putative NAD dependent epimerase/dehydratase n=1 Tax=Decorospora gaudefroyi TaxID=184978 RepID=A0A6A5KKF6_9PLEO|nr:putative NAD dependent epimerase/dehydratase [Decorospora gaudefroyi]